MKNIRLTIEYDGSRYCGWQRQENRSSIQEVLEKALGKITGETISVHGSGRTDAGVHALGQVANFHTDSTVPPLKFHLALNSLLPDDISVIDSCEVPKAFHARFSATGKHYRYILVNREVRPALMCNRAGFVSGRLNMESMETACSYLVGTHDFRCFMASGSRIGETVRTVYEAFVEMEGDIVSFDIKGNGFLYNMVRIIAGTLVDIGTGKTNPHDMIDIIAGKDRGRAGKTMPAEGLYLVDVFY